MSTPSLSAVHVPVFGFVLLLPIVEVGQFVVVLLELGFAAIRAHQYTSAVLAGSVGELVLGSTARCRAKPVQARREEPSIMLWQPRVEVLS